MSRAFVAANVVVVENILATAQYWLLLRAVNESVESAVSMDENNMNRTCLAVG